MNIRTGLITAALVAAPAVASAVEIIPMLGIADFENEDGDADYESGLALGVSIGGRLAPIFSLHGQLHYHRFTDSTDDADGNIVSLQLAPLFHLVDNRTLDLMVGPVFGFTRQSVVFDGGVLDDYEASVTGPLVGLHAGLYFRLNETLSLGPTFQYSKIYASEACVEFNGDRECREVDDDVDPLTFILFNAGLKIAF
ncbi:MAG: outer membrane beta-barrel protein [bacterium]